MESLSGISKVGFVEKYGLTILHAKIFLTYTKWSKMGGLWHSSCEIRVNEYPLHYRKFCLRAVCKVKAKATLSQENSTNCKNSGK